MSAVTLAAVAALCCVHTSWAQQPQLQQQPQPYPQNYPQGHAQGSDGLGHQAAAVGTAPQNAYGYQHHAVQQQAGQLGGQLGGQPLQLDPYGHSRQAQGGGRAQVFQAGDQTLYEVDWTYPRASNAPSNLVLKRWGGQQQGQSPPEYVAVYRLRGPVSMLGDEVRHYPWGAQRRPGTPGWTSNPRDEEFEFLPARTNNGLQGHGLLQGQGQTAVQQGQGHAGLHGQGHSAVQGHGGIPGQSVIQGQGHTGLPNQGVMQGQGHTGIQGHAGLQGLGGIPGQSVMQGQQGAYYNSGAVAPTARGIGQQQAPQQQQQQQQQQQPYQYPYHPHTAQ